MLESFDNSFNCCHIATTLNESPSERDETAPFYLQIRRDTTHFLSLIIVNLTLTNYRDFVTSALPYKRKIISENSFSLVTI